MVRFPSPVKVKEILMQRTIILVFVACFATLSRPNAAPAGTMVLVGASATIDLYGTGYDTDLNHFIYGHPNPALSDLKVNLTGTVGGVLPSQSFTRDSYDWRLYVGNPISVLGEVNITSTATVHAAGGTVGLSVSNTSQLIVNPANAQSQFPELSLFQTAQSRVSVNWSDELKLSGPFHK